MRTVLAFPVTADDLLAMPEDGVERWIVAGVLREGPVTGRNRFHSYTMTAIATELENWRRQQPEPRGQVLTGDVGVRLRRDPDTVFGVDVVYLSAEVVARQSGERTIIEGVPTQVVEILSPRDTIEQINEKVDAYLEAGVALVWTIDPHRRTVTVHRGDSEPELFNVQQTLTGGTHLAGLEVPVRRLFA